MIPGPSTTRLSALSISAPVRTFFSAPHRGQVVATFARSCYLDLDGQIIALVSPDLRNGPLNVVVDAASACDHLSIGAAVASTARMIQLDRAREIGLDAAATWDPMVPCVKHAAWVQVHDHLQTLADLVAAEAPAGGLARVGLGVMGAQTSVLERSASPAFADVVAGLRASDASVLTRGARALAGLGPGLTPAGDDIAMGCLLALAVLPTAGAARMREAIVTGARGRTTRISEAYLDAAARGEASESWHRLIAAASTPDRARVRRAGREVLAVGETSGSDMITGFVLAARVLLEGPLHSAHRMRTLGV